ncbi:SDR family oxidoreductase [Solirubrobacter ginsenosidimutans]|uniref:SDR family oxidoreductase n=1 Tax=Solirubrobacter ginsenosidimutans TaxID=490573 RepID=A0A9X3N2B8_9ACTN|nr:SDR family oxidoreductase [Solirubrobacter ginsenosidimutans]MDA0167199.1 SDR family oxidoreductase [Solirubrobacter ginsenosidimutans]
MIVITGATGQLGQGIAERLLERVPAAKIGVSVRTPENARALRERGVRVRQADYDDAASLRHAFEGASTVLIVSASTHGVQALRQHQTAIDAARAAGVQRIVYTSHMGVGASSAFVPMVDHAATEERLHASNVAFTSLRNGFYTASGLMFMGQALQTGKLIAPEDGPVSWTAHADLAEAAAIALTDATSLDGLTAPLTASEALDLADIAAVASEVTGREITRVTISDDEYRAGMVARGVPEAQADLLLGVFAASRRGEFAAVDPTLEQLLGRAPTSVRDVIAAAE